MYLILLRIDRQQKNYKICKTYTDLATAEQAYQDLLLQYDPDQLDLVESAAVGVTVAVDADTQGVEVSPLRIPVATETAPGLIQLTKPGEVSYENPVDEVQGIPIILKPSQVKVFVDDAVETIQGGYVRDIVVNDETLPVDHGTVTMTVPTDTAELTNGAGYITLNDIPSIPSATSQLTNDSGFITSSDIPTNVSSFNNDAGYITSSDIPSIPSATSQLTNDSGFITSSDIPTNVSSFNNDADYQTGTEVEEAIAEAMHDISIGDYLTVATETVDTRSFIYYQNQFKEDAFGFRCCNDSRLAASPVVENLTITFDTASTFEQESFYYHAGFTSIDGTIDGQEVSIIILNGLIALYAWDSEYQYLLDEIRTIGFDAPAQSVLSFALDEPAQGQNGYTWSFSCPTIALPANIEDWPVCIAIDDVLDNGYASYPDNNYEVVTVTNPITGISEQALQTINPIIIGKTFPEAPTDPVVGRFNLLLANGRIEVSTEDTAEADVLIPHLMLQYTQPLYTGTAQIGSPNGVIITEQDIFINGQSLLTRETPLEKQFRLADVKISKTASGSYTAANADEVTTEESYEVWHYNHFNFYGIPSASDISFTWADGYSVYEVVPTFTYHENEYSDIYEQNMDFYSAYGTYRPGGRTLHINIFPNGTIWFSYGSGSNPIAEIKIDAGVSSVGKLTVGNTTTLTETALTINEATLTEGKISAIGAIASTSVAGNVKTTTATGAEIYADPSQYDSIDGVPIILTASQIKAMIDAAGGGGSGSQVIVFTAGSMTADSTG